MVLVHCYGGLGRTGVVAACLLLSVDEHMTPEEAVDRLRALRGPRAIASVKQYNFVHEFRQLSKEHEERALSR